MSIEDKNNRVVSNEELTQVTGGRFEDRLLYELCDPEEGIALNRDGGSYRTYNCSDPANKGKKRSCSGCPAN